MAELLPDGSKEGLTVEFEGWQEDLFRRSLPTPLIVHRAGARVLPDNADFLDVTVDYRSHRWVDG